MNRHRHILILIILILLGAPAAVSAEGTDDFEMIRQASLKILSLNIHGGVNWNGEYDFEGLLGFIREVNPDLIGLQEVDRVWSQRSHFQDICRELAQELNMSYAFSVSLERNDGFFGNQILSKYPIIQEWAERLPGILESRSFIFAQVLISGIKVNVINTHLGLSEEDRRLQAEDLVEFIGRINGPLIVMGDFNGSAADYGVSLLHANLVDLQENSEAKGRGTFKRKDGNASERIDYILTTPDFLLDNCQIVENNISDHLPLLAEVTLWAEVQAAPQSGLEQPGFF